MGNALSTVPSAWNCPDEWYNNGTRCDCSCDAWDPDCADPNLPSTCGANAVCTHDATCVTPTGWTASTDCAAAHYGTHDGCHCCPGATDPDCADPTQIAMCGSVPSASCSAGVCTSGWTCSDSQFGDGICNCGSCGASDIDCMVLTTPTDCGSNASECNVNNVCWLPRTWSCAASKYDDGAYCDCCNGWDVDCADTSLPLRSCGAGYDECTIAGKCTVAGCANNNVDVRAIQEPCDGGIGCDQCSCLTGYEPFVPAQFGCRPICNDTIVVTGEECDSGTFCVNCHCIDSNHPPYPTPRKYCQGCGNNVVDTVLSEECDGGTGCNITTCKCNPGYEPYTVPYTSCKVYTSDHPLSSSSSPVHDINPVDLSSSSSSLPTGGHDTSTAGSSNGGSTHDSRLDDSTKYIPSDEGGKFPVALVCAIVGVILALGIIAAIVAAVVISKRKSEQNKSVLGSGGHAEMSLLPAQAAAPMLPLFDIADKKYGLALTPNSLSFGELKIGEPATKTIVVRNRLDEQTEVTFNAPSDIFHAVVLVEPLGLSLGKAGSKTCSSEVRITLTLKCTTKVAAGLMVVNGNVGYAMLPISAQGAKSLMLDPDDLQRGETVVSVHEDYTASKIKWENRDMLLKEISRSLPPEVLSAMHAEIELFSSIRCPLLAPALLSAANAFRTCIAVEFAPLGTLEMLIAGSDKRLESRIQVKFGLDCARGMNVLHERNVVHGALRPSNMLIFSTNPDDEVCLKVGDFGSVGVLHRMPLTPTSLIYIAPEVLHAGIAPTKNSDVYAYGFSLYYMADTPGFTRRVGMSPESLAVTKTANLGPTHEVIIRCTSMDPATRGTFAEALVTVKDAVREMPFHLSEMPVK